MFSFKAAGKSGVLDILAPHGWGVLFLPGSGTIREFYPYCSYHSGSAPRASSLAVVISNTLAPPLGCSYIRKPHAKFSSFEAASQRCTVAVFFNSEAALRAYSASLE